MQFGLCSENFSYQIEFSKNTNKQRNFNPLTYSKTGGGSIIAAWVVMTAKMI